MQEIICDDIAHRAGFIVPTGNWISPSGLLILGKSYDEHHWETAKKHFNISSHPNQLQFMNEKIQEGYIRLVIRADILFQVGCKSPDEIWSTDPNYKTMMKIISRIPGVDIHIFGQSFYIIGRAEDILSRNSKLEIRTK